MITERKLVKNANNGMFVDKWVRNINRTFFKDKGFALHEPQDEFEWIA